MITLLLSSLLTLVSLNCENLFDTEHDSLKNDTEWLPDGQNHWTRTRYGRKLNMLGQEILACGGEQDWQLPDLVALCEVENDSVLTDLTQKSLLRKARYQYVMTDSPDPRGIDVALLYSPFTFRLLSHHAIRIPPLPSMHPTRDILYACGQLTTGDTLHVIVVHAPSRSGGEHATRPHRLLVADHVAATVDSIHHQQPDAHIVVCGDFNDYTGDKSIRRIEQAGLTDVSSRATGSHGAQGTYRYRGEWGSLDHIFVSPSLNARTIECFIFDAPFLLTDDEAYGGKKPRRNYLGPHYQRGFSDHLPLVVRF